MLPPPDPAHAAPGPAATNEEILMPPAAEALALTAADSLPRDGAAALLVGRLWLPGTGPVAVTVHEDALIDLSSIAPTTSQLFELNDLVPRLRALLRSADARRIAPLQTVLANSPPDGRDRQRPWLLAPCDLQVIKASGVTFVASMLERVIEEQARGDAARAESIRASLAGVLGDNLAGIVPGSPEAARVKALLVEQGAWSQYLEVGIGPDAEIFTKAPVLSAVGTGADVGIHPESAWNNPEPEVVLAVNSRGMRFGAALGNDVNLRDLEGRSALLLGKAKDNNASCAIGPFVRLFDESFDIARVRRCEITIEVRGPDGFLMTGNSSLARISRDPLDLVAQAIGPNHAYPDGLMLFLGTMFAPTQDRRGPGQGFTHEVGDLVRISAPELGLLANRVVTCDRAERWDFGITALMRNLAGRGLL